MRTRGALSVILDKLLDNALRYTNSGSVHLVWSLAAQGAGTGRLEVVVRDSGIGIAIEEIEQVFGKYYRSAQDHVQRIEGSGLGLFIARAVAENAGGTLAVESKLGIGTRFSLELPVQLIHRSEAHTDTRTSDLIALVTSADPDEKDALGMLLVEAGAKAIFVDSSIEALMSLEQQSVGVAFLGKDLSDPGTDQLAEQILARSPETRIELITDGRRLRSYRGSRGATDRPIERWAIESILADMPGETTGAVVDFAVARRAKGGAGENSAS